MTGAVANEPYGDRPAAGTLLVTGIVLAALTEAMAGTVLTLGRVSIMGDIHATPDEFAGLDVGYTAAKLAGFMTVPWLINRVDPLSVIVAATLVMGAACGIAANSAQLELLILLRAIQGLCGGVLLVGGQTIIFLAYPRFRQPILQALFATGAVVAPATITPALHGWLIDTQSWRWIFSSIAPLALVATGLLLVAKRPAFARALPGPFDWIGFSLISIALFSFTYVLSQGSRWNWFEEPWIVWLTVIGAGVLLAFFGQQVIAKNKSLFDFSAFRSDDFSFAFVVSFVAGAALFGSSFLIPTFALSMLSFTPTDVGLLLLPSGGLFVGALALSAFLMQCRRTPPIATVPFGVMMIATAMWMLSGSTSESGTQDMMMAILLRGLGLGFLFLSITLIAFGNLDGRSLAYGIGLFNTGRQLGGLVSVAGLQTLIDHNAASNTVILGAYITAGAPAVSERLNMTAAMFSAKGLEAVDASKAASRLLESAVSRQAIVISFDTAFNAVAVLFLIAGPILIAVKIGIARRKRMRAAPSGSRITSRGPE